VSNAPTVLVRDVYVPYNDPGLLLSELKAAPAAYKDVANWRALHKPEMLENDGALDLEVLNNEAKTSFEAYLYSCNQQRWRILFGVPKLDASPTEGRKFDGDKDDYSLVPPKAFAGLVRVLTYGARKYAPDNWRYVENRKARYFSAAMRHLWAWWRGEEKDAETGESHLHHAACCISFLADEFGE
jgi:hypothetical protein